MVESKCGKIWQQVEISIQQVEKDNVTGGNWNQQVEIRNATSGVIGINKWIGKALQVIGSF